MSIEDQAHITVTSNLRSPHLCSFIVVVDGWQSVVKFSIRALWLQDLFLRFVYKYGKLVDVSYPKASWPPNIEYSFPKDKLAVLNALRNIKAKHKKRLLEMESRFVIDKLEQEIIALGIAEGLGKDDS